MFLLSTLLSRKISLGFYFLCLSSLLLPIPGAIADIADTTNVQIEDHNDTSPVVQCGLSIRDLEPPTDAQTQTEEAGTSQEPAKERKLDQIRLAIDKIEFEQTSACSPELLAALSKALWSFREEDFPHFFYFDIPEIIWEQNLDPETGLFLIGESDTETLEKILPHLTALRERIQGAYVEQDFLLNRAIQFVFEPAREDQEKLSPWGYYHTVNLKITIQEPKIGKISYEIVQGDDNNKTTVGRPCTPGHDILETDNELSPVTFLKHQELCDRLTSIVGGINPVIRYQDMQESLLYWKNSPIVKNIEAYFQNADNNDLVDLNVVIDPEEEEQFLLGFDNTSPESVGDEKFSIAYVHNNPEKVGDRLTVGYTGTTSGGIRAVNFGYQVPIGVTDKSLSFNFAPSWTRVTQEPFEDFDITARAQLFSVKYHHPLIRNVDEDLAFTLGFEFQNGQTFIFNDVPTAFGFGANDEGITRTSNFIFGQQYSHRTTSGAWVVDSEFNFGTDLFGATAGRWNEPGGMFNRWELYAQRLQKLSTKHRLLMEAQVQLTPKTLPSSQQFTIGGMNTVRGYRANARTADNGLRFSIEDYIVLETDEAGFPHTELIPFIDLGWVWNNPGTSNGLLDQRFLLSTGIGFKWHQLFGFDDLTARLDIAIPFFDIEDRGYALQDDGIYFSINYDLF